MQLSGLDSDLEAVNRRFRRLLMVVVAAFALAAVILIAYAGHLST